MSIYRRSTQEKVRVDRLWNRTTPRTTSGAASQSGVGGPLPEHAHTGTGTGGILAFAFVTIGNTASLSNERALTAGNRFVITDGGAGSTVTLSARGIQDADNDTYIDAEASADEDILRFVTAGTHRARITSAALLLVNDTDFIMYTDDGISSTIRFDATTGHAVFGNTGAGIDPNNTLDISHVYTDPTALVTGTTPVVTIQMTAGNSQNLRTVSSAAGVSGAFTHSGILYGFYSTISITNSATATDFRQFYAHAGSTRPLGTRYGFRMDDWLGAGVLTTQYGIYLENLDAASTNWAIYSLGGNSAHVGSITVGGSSAPVTTLDVRGAVTLDGISAPGTPASDDIVIYNETGTDLLKAKNDGGVVYHLTHDFEVSITVESPTSSEDISIRFFDRAVTMVEVHAVVVGSSTPSVTINPVHGNDRSAAGTALLSSATAITNTTSGQSLTSFNDSTLNAGDILRLKTTAKSGTVTELHVTFRFRLT